MNSALLEVKEIAKGLTQGNRNVYTSCPFCKSSDKNCFSVSLMDDGAVVYHCFRNKCQISGRLRETGSFSFDTSYVAPRKPEKKIDTRELVPLEDYTFLPVQDLSVEPRWDKKRELVMYPVLSCYGERIGYVQRHYKEVNSWWKGPKAMNIVENTTVPWAHFPEGQTITDHITVVEDVPSAEAIRKYSPSVSLCGTNISDSLLGLLLRLGISKLNICLDNDALAKAAKLKRELALTFAEINVVFVDKDPKDMNEEELRELCQNLCTQT